MTSWKTSEIARRLAERDEVEPPEGLLEKIKSDIPPVLPALPKGPEIVSRPRPSRRGVWLMAASLAATVGGGLFGLWMMQTKTPSYETVMRRGPQAPNPAAAPPPAALQDQRSPAEAAAPEPGGGPGGAEPEEKTRAAGAKEKEKDEDRLRSLSYVSGGRVKPQDQPQPVQAPPAAPPAAEPPALRQETIAAQAESAPKPVAGVPGGVVGGTPGNVAGKDERRADKQTAMKKAAPPQEAASSLDKELLDAKRDPINVGGNESGRQAEYSRPAPAPPPAAAAAAPPTMQREAADAPPSAARAQALMGALSFGGEALSKVNAAVRADGAPNPFAAGDRERLVRLDVPAAAAGRVKIDFNPAAVASWRRLGTDHSMATETARTETVAAGPGRGATALYAVTLQPDAQPGEPLVTLHLGASSQVLRVGALAPSWEAAPPGLRLASLAAELGEVLRGAPSAQTVDVNDLVRRTRTLANEVTGTSREADANELLHLAEEAARRR